MPSPLIEYRKRYGLSHESLAAELTEKLGRPVKAQRIRDLESRDTTGKRIPKSYRAALGLDPEPAPATVYDFPDPAGRSLDDEPAPAAARLDDPPMMPPDGRRVSASRPEHGAVGGEMQLAKDRIAQAYNAVGAGLSMASRNDGYSEAMKLYSPDIADAWVKAAAENQHVATIVRFMESGGAVGELVFCHVVLVFGLVYVSGRAPQLGIVVADRLRPWHERAHGAREVERLAAEQDEFAAATNGAQGPLGAAGGVAAA